jgi:hypothetical protein
MLSRYPIHNHEFDEEVGDSVPILGAA